MNERIKNLVCDLFWILLVLAIAFCFVAMLGCASSKPIETPPRLETEEVTTPLPCIYEIALLPDLVLPEMPPFPGEEAGEAEIKNWLVELKTAIGTRDARLTARIEAYELKIKTHNSQEPKCSQIE